MQSDCVKVIKNGRLEEINIQLEEDQNLDGLFAAFSSHLKSRVGNTLAKAAALRVNLNLEGAPITSK